VATVESAARPQGSSLSRVRTRLLSDERVAELVTAGNAEAFSVLYERYYGPIYRYCFAILRHSDDARDALQTTMLNAFRSLSDRSEGLSVRPWLYRIAHNAAISLVRQRRDHSELPEELSSGRLPVDELVQRTVAGEILEDLAELPARRRGALVMRELQGLRYEEIALALDVTPGAARQAVFEARLALTELRAGGDLDCRQACERISTRDGRRLRSRPLRAHLKACDSCRRFGRLVHARRRGLAALPSLAVGAQMRILDNILRVGGSETVAAVAAIEAKGGGLTPVLKAAVTGIAVLVLGAGGVVVDGLRKDEKAGASPNPPSAPAALPAEPLGRAASVPVAVEVPDDARSEEQKRRKRRDRPAPEGAAVLAAAQPADPPAPERLSAPSETVPVAGNGGSSSGSAGGGGSQSSPAQQPSTTPSEEPASGSSGGGEPSGSGGDPQPSQSAGSGGDVNPPAQSAPPPEQGGTPPGQGGAPPAQGTPPPAQSAPPPDDAAAPPGQGGTPPGQGGTPPGQAAASAGPGTPPGQGGTPPGHGGTPPGQA